jgi:hypothetical protein
VNASFRLEKHIFTTKRSGNAVTFLKPVFYWAEFFLVISRVELIRKDKEKFRSEVFIS